MRNRVIKIIGNLLMVASLIFVASILISYEIDFSRFLTWSFLGMFVVVVLTYMLTTFLGSQNWRLWLELFSEGKLGVKSTFQVFAKSNLGKYLPGNVMHYVNRQIFCRSLGLKQSEIATSSILEVLAIVLIAIILSLILSFHGVLELFIRYTLPQINFLLVALGLVALLIILVVLWSRLKSDSRVEHVILCIKRKFFLTTFLKTSIIYVFMFFITGGILYMLLLYDIELGWEQLLLVISASIISFVIGFITPGVPAGIGVREAVLMFFLAGIAPEYIIVTAVIFQRFGHIIGELLAWLLSEVLIRGKKRVEGEEQN